MIEQEKEAALFKTTSLYLTETSQHAEVPPVTCLFDSRICSTIYPTVDSHINKLNLRVGE